MSKVLTIVVKTCMSCPKMNYNTCPAWSALSKKDKVFMQLSSQAVNILPNCPLPDVEGEA